MAYGAQADGGSLADHDSVTAFRSKRVVTLDKVRPASVLVRDGVIVELADWDSIPANSRVHDFGELVLLPGLVDTHVHINDPGRASWEGFATATRAAAAGGMTAVVDMPLNCSPETTTVEALETKRAAARGQCFVDWATWGGVVGHEGSIGNEADISGLIAAGVPGFKCFLIDSGIDSFAWSDEAQLRRALAVLQGSGLPLLAHAEVAGPVAEATVRLNAGLADWRRYATYLASRPDEAELEAIGLLIRLAEKFDAHIHIVHLATARALPMLKSAREAGLKITVETCPQYLWFAAEEIPDGATEFKCAPPIRSATNRKALWWGLLDGVIDFIATDHSPCPPEMKDRRLDSNDAESGRFDRAWGGVASLGLALPVVWTGLQDFGGDLSSITKWLSGGPARLAGLDRSSGASRKGRIAPGFDADFAVFDPDERWSVGEADLHFRHKLSPYVGANLRGKVLETWLRGERIFQQSNGTALFASVSTGQELRRNDP
ncbi:allantoinase AllB [Acidicapsa dinghuensis]|uniref:allantoinase n=1 Tax=Acidicapsa dinghuensis TaxID=2218256 RepID=A0ABW1EJA6_9BACT|nr:allantoinase AllB [Acidicapsa dinghuensis]